MSREEKRQNRLVRLTAEIYEESLNEKLSSRQAYLLGFRQGFRMARMSQEEMVFRFAEEFKPAVMQLRGDETPS
jgi:hypothetical protein